MCDASCINPEKKPLPPSRPSNSDGSFEGEAGSEAVIRRAAESLLSFRLPIVKLDDDGKKETPLHREAKRPLFGLTSRSCIVFIIDINAFNLLSNSRISSSNRRLARSDLSSFSSCNRRVSSSSRRGTASEGREKTNRR